LYIVYCIHPLRACYKTVTDLYKMSNFWIYGVEHCVCVCVCVSARVRGHARIY
jgi:hypothetical protein